MHTHESLQARGGFGPKTQKEISILLSQLDLTLGLKLSKAELKHFKQAQLVTRFEPRQYQGNTLLLTLTNEHLK